MVSVDEFSASGDVTSVFYVLTIDFSLKNSLVYVKNANKSFEGDRDYIAKVNRQKKDS